MRAGSPQQISPSNYCIMRGQFCPCTGNSTYLLCGRWDLDCSLELINAMNPLEARWAKEPVLTIDGGLGTEIENKGVNIVSASLRAKSTL